MSPRAALGLLRAARARAASLGRDYVVPDDLKALALPVLEHRLALTGDAQLRGVNRADVLLSVLGSVSVPVGPLTAPVTERAAGHRSERPVRGLLTRRGWGVVVGAVVLAAGRADPRAGGAVRPGRRQPGPGWWRRRSTSSPAGSTWRRPASSTRPGSTPATTAGWSCPSATAARRRSPVLTLRDALAGGPRQARFLLPPLAPGQSDQASYRLPADRRGVFAIGPLEAERSDPFGLARRSSAIAPVAELTVYPRIDRVRPLPDSPGRDRHHTTPRAAAVGLTGEDFYALRAYQQGDDLRRVHWPSTAQQQCFACCLVGWSC